MDTLESLEFIQRRAKALCRRWHVRDGEDAAQTAALWLLRFWSKSSVWAKPVLYGIARRAVANSIRKAHWRALRDNRLKEEQVVYPEEEPPTAILDKVQDCLGHRQRRFLDGLRCGTSVAQMARIMGVSNQTAYIWRRQIIAKGKRLVRT